MTRAATVTQVEVLRAIKAALQTEARLVVEVQRGKLRIIVNDKPAPKKQGVEL